jgi:hypothetical protein
MTMAVSCLQNRSNPEAVLKYLWLKPENAKKWRNLLVYLKGPYPKRL